MDNTTNITIRVDRDVKAAADMMLNEMGMSISNAFNIFLRQLIRDGKFPFEITLNRPTRETIEAMLEAERIAKDPTVRGYNNTDELFAELEK